MPKLLVLAPCEKVVISQDENNPTLIAILTDVGAQYQAEPGANLPLTTIIPMRWAIFTMWKREPGDESRSFFQRVEFTSPTTNRQIIKSTDVDLTFDKAIQRIIMHMPGLPVGDNGEWTMKIYLGEHGQPFPKDPLATFPLNVTVVETTELG